MRDNSLKYIFRGKVIQNDSTLKSYYMYPIATQEQAVKMATLEADSQQEVAVTPLLDPQPRPRC